MIFAGPSIWNLLHQSIGCQRHHGKPDLKDRFDVHYTAINTIHINSATCLQLNYFSNLLFTFIGQTNEWSKSPCCQYGYYKTLDCANKYWAGCCSTEILKHVHKCSIRNINTTKTTARAKLTHNYHYDQIKNTRIYVDRFLNYISTYTNAHSWDSGIKNIPARSQNCWVEILKILTEIYTSSLPLLLVFFRTLYLHRGHVALMCSHLSMQTQ